VEDKKITPVEPYSTGISDYVLAHKEWIFDGCGTELVVVLVSITGAGVMWLYKRFFRSSNSISLPISIQQPLDVRLQSTKEQEGIALEPVTEVSEMVKRFNIVLNLMNPRHPRPKYTIAKLAQIMQLDSVGEL
jgi:hypothetical protein